MEEAHLHESFNDIFSLVPVHVYRHDLKGKGIYSPLHWHNSIEISVPLTGRIRFNAGSSDFDFGESDWIILNSGELHSCRNIDTSDHYIGISVLLSKNFVDQWLGKNLFFRNPEDPELTIRIKSLALKIYHLDTEDPAYSLKLMSLVYDLMVLLSVSCCIHPTEAAPDLSSADTAAFIDYIEANYRDDLPLEKAAEHFGYSAAYFSRRFKETLGVNFLSYLNFVRVSHAARQIAAGSCNLTDIAYANGFSNSKSFINGFRKVYGCTPSAYAASLK